MDLGRADAKNGTMADTPFDDPCALCGGAWRRHRRDWLRRCGDCEALRADLPVTIGAGSVIDEEQREAGLDTLRRVNNGRLLDHLAALAGPAATLLDVGCGPGFLLRDAAQKGFSPSGIEPDVDVVAAAAAQGAPVRHGFFPDALGPDERFDIIVFNDVLEHIADIPAALAASAAHLNEGGLLCVNCPDQRGLIYRVADLADRMGFSGALKRLWQVGLPSPHLWYLTPAALERAAQRAGLRRVSALRMESVVVKGLWRRIRYVKGQSLALSLAAYAFALSTLPLARLLPADSSAVIFRRA
jgi:SAM-dependent methyltransferase